jgi:oxygen-dependent protoporphyrinogen oxidase
MRTAIIGGGIAGLAAAYELERARAAGADVEYTLFESRDRLGGSLSSEIVDGTVLERGPDSFLTEKPAGIELCRELGLGEQLTPSNDAERKTYILVKNRMVALPDGLMFLVPTKLVPTALTPLFSIKTKIKMGLELLHPPRPTGLPDESVAALVSRHFGAEAVDRLADPLLSGIYGGDAAQLSARTVLPKLVEMESEYGSLTRGMLAAHQKMAAKAREAAQQKRNGAGAGNGGAAGGGPGSDQSAKRAARTIFTTLKGGMQQLVDALVAKIKPEWLRLGTAVSALEKTATGWVVEAGGIRESYDAVIVCSQAWAAGALLRGVDQELSEGLVGIPYSSSITLNLVYDEKKLPRLPDGFGFLVPASEGRAMLACTFVHRKFLGRTAPGKAVLRAFLGGMKNEALLTEPDEVLVETARREFKEILGITAEPEHVQVSRWKRAMAQYAVGHQERVKHVHERVATLPGLKLAGNAYDGIGIPDCIRLGRTAAQEVVASQRVCESGGWLRRQAFQSSSRAF